MHCMHYREWAEAGARYYRPHGSLGDNFRAWYMTAADWHMAVTAPYPYRPIFIPPHSPYWLCESML